MKSDTLLVNTETKCTPLTQIENDENELNMERCNWNITKSAKITTKEKMKTKIKYFI